MADAVREEVHDGTDADAGDRDRPERGVLDLLRNNPRLSSFLLARSLSQIGDALTVVGLAFAILRFSDSAGVGLVLASRAIPSLLLLPVGGVFGDRLPRKAVLVASEAVSAVVLITAGALLVAGNTHLLYYCLLLAGRGAAGALFGPVSTSAISYIAPEDSRRRVYAMFNTVGNVSDIAGPAVAGLLLAVLSPGWLLIFDGTTFAASILLVGVGGSLGRAQPRARAGGYLRDLAEGVRVVRSIRWLYVLIAGAAFSQFFLLAPLQVLGPVVAVRSLGGSGAWAAISTALGLGSLVGGLVAVRVRARRPLLLGYGLLLLGAGPTLLLLAVPAPLPWLVASQFVSGVVISFFSAAESAAVANGVPADVLSRVDSLNRVGSMALMPLGTAFVGSIAAAVGLSPTLVVAGLAALLTVVVPLMTRDVREVRA